MPRWERVRETLRQTRASNGQMPSMCVVTLCAVLRTYEVDGPCPRGLHSFPTVCAWSLRQVHGQWDSPDTSISSTTSGHAVGPAEVGGETERGHDEARAVCGRLRRVRPHLCPGDAVRTGRGRALL